MSSYKRKLMSGPNVVVSLWLCAMFVIFPLIYNDYYYDILQTKYATVLILTSIMLAALLVMGSFSGGLFKPVSDIREKGFAAWFKEELSFVDKCILLYMIITVISTLQAAPYIKEAVLGNEGRYSGLILISMYVAIYFTVSRLFVFNKIYFTIFLTVSIPMCLFGFTDYFNMNLLGFKTYMNPEQWSTFTSTIGNINTYTAFIAFFTAVAGTLFITTPLKTKRSSKGEGIGKVIFYYVIMVMNFFALTMGNSDNGYLTLAAFFSLMPFVAFRNTEGVRRYILTLASYLLSIKCINIINSLNIKKVVGITGLYDFISKFKYLDSVILLLALAAAFMYILAYKNIKEENINSDEENKNLLAMLRRIWLAVLILGALAVVFLGIGINMDVEDSRAKYGSIVDYFVFNDAWGTYRGYIWRASLEEYMQLPILHKIFGSGPDTFGIYINNTRYTEMVSVTSQFFDASHNEYIQFLFTLGPIATVSYILALVATSVNALRTKLGGLSNDSQLPFLYASAFAVICYGTQAIVNLNLPVVTPLLWIFLSLTAAMLREKRRTLNG